MSRVAAALTILLAAGAGAHQAGGALEPAPGEDRAARERAFDAGYAEVRALAHAQRFEDAYDAYRALLAAHARAPYVLGRAAEVEADLRSLAFLRAHEPPAIEDLLEAELLRLDRERGDVRLRLRPDALGDCVRHDGPDRPLYELPLAWNAAWTATISGTADALAGMQIQVCLPDGGGYAVSIGGSPDGAKTYAHEILHRARPDDEPGGLASAAPAPLPPGRRVEARVRVSARSIELDYDRVRVLTAQRADAPDFGRLAFAPARGFDELVVDGRADPGFFQGRVDAATEAARAAFERAWRAEQHLPPWLIEALGDAAARAEPRGAVPLPGVFDLAVAPHPRTREHLDAVTARIDQGRPDLALAYLDALDAAAIEPAVRAFLATLALHASGRPRDAHAAGAALFDAQAGSRIAGALEAAVLVALKRDAEAGARLRELCAVHPTAWEPWYALASLELRHGRAADALDALDRGEAAADDPTALYGLERRVALVREGPPWTRTVETRALHFVVRSGADAATARLVAREAESAWRDLERLLGRAAAPERTIPLLVFPGESSYRAYATRAIAADAQHSAGLFDRNLQAILTWSTPARDDLLRTVRHEVLHQYLDLRYGAIPVWLSEGMAEYHEIVVQDRGLPRAGDVHPEHRATLARRAPRDLREFLHVTPAAFYADAELAYAQAWALVHFLQHSGLDEKRRLRDLWTRLERREDDASAIAGAFAGVDWAAWNARFAAHVARLVTAR